jgi:RNA polymerase-binding transcription factor DksA
MPNSKHAKGSAKKSHKAAPTHAAKKPSKPVSKAAPKAAPAGKINGAKAKSNKAAAKPVKAPPARSVAAPKPTVAKSAPVKLTPFLEKQKDRLLHLRDSLLDSMSGVAKDTLRARAEGSEASAFGMHQADAGSDAYDRDFALSLLSQEQDALYEIEEALKRIDAGTYGVCEMSGEKIAQARLEALPFARYTVECQAQFERMKKINRSRAPVTSLFGLTDDDSDDDGDEEPAQTESKEDKE